jgi:hypothetical protein
MSQITVSVALVSNFLSSNGRFEDHAAAKGY